MAEPSGAPTPISPFDPTPTRPTSGAGGCGKPVLIGCLGLLVLLGIGIVIFLVKAPDLLPALTKWMFQQLEPQVLAQLPDDLPDAERDRLKQAFADAVRAVESDNIDPARFQEIQPKLMKVAREPNRKLTREEVRELTAALEEFAGTGSTSNGDGEPPPAPIPGTTGPDVEPPVPPEP